jgi:hypothetical protein
MKPNARKLSVFALGVALLLRTGSFASAETLAASDIENLSRYAANDAKEFLRVAEDEGKKFRGKEAVLVLAVRNTSQKWELSAGRADEDQQELPSQLARALATPGRVRTEMFSVSPAKPESDIWKALTEMLGKPGEKWIDEDARVQAGVRWVVYGYLLDVPGQDKPCAVLKMTDIKDRTLVWGGCFSVDAAEPGHRDKTLYPACKQIAESFEVPSWAKSKEDVRHFGTYLPRTRKGASPGKAEELSEAEEAVFADLAAIELLRAKTRTGKYQWFDPAIVWRVVETAAKAAEGETKPVSAYDLLAGIRSKPGWEGLDTFVTGTVELERPKVKSAVLQFLTLATPQAADKPLSAYVMSGYCSEEGGHASRRDWVRRTVEPGLRLPQRGVKMVKVAETTAFKDGDPFRDTVEVAVAQPEVPECRVLGGNCPGQDGVNYEVMSFTDGGEPPHSLYMFISDAQSGNILWARKQSRPGARAPDPTYAEYCVKVQMSMRSGATDYGRHPSVVWHLQESKEAGAGSVGTWNPNILGLELATSLVDPSRAFIRKVAATPFGAGSYAELLKAVEEPQKPEDRPQRVVAFQLVSRGTDKRPALVVKYLNPANGMIHWAFYDEPSGTPLAEADEDAVLQKIQESVSQLQVASAQADQETATLVGDIEDHGLLNMGRRPYEMLVTQLASRRGRLPVEWPYLLTRNAADPGSGVLSVFDDKTHQRLSGLKVASFVQAEWFPSPSGAKQQSRPTPLQCLVWETSPYELVVEGFTANPSSGAVADQKPQCLPGLQFLHRLLKVLMNGASNTQEWKSLDVLKDKSPLMHQVLSFALQDYKANPGLTQNIVIDEGDGTWQVASRGTDASSAAAARGFSGFLKDPVMSQFERDALFVGVSEVRLRPGTAVSEKKAGTQVARLYPPDWRSKYPDGGPLLDLDDATVASLFRRNAECLIRQAGLSALNAAGLQLRCKFRQKPDDKPEASEPDLLLKFAKETDLRTVQLSLDLSDLRAFMLQDASGKTFLVHSLTVKPSAEVIHPQSQILGSLPSSLRYFLVQTVPTKADGSDPLRQLLRTQLMEAAKADQEQLSRLWASGLKKDDVRRLRAQLFVDLGQWSANFAVAKDTVKDIVLALADESIRLETAWILEQRKKVESEKQAEELKAVKTQGEALLEAVKGWVAQHPSLAGKEHDAILRLAEDAVEAHLATITVMLDTVAKEFDLKTLEEMQPKVETGRTLANWLMEDLAKWVAASPTAAGQVEKKVLELADRFIRATRDRANGFGPTFMKMKREEKEEKDAGLTIVQQNAEDCLADMEKWSAGFPGIKDILKQEKSQTAGWNRKDWKKTEPEPAKTLQDIVVAATEELEGKKLLKKSWNALLDKIEKKIEDVRKPDKEKKP